MQGSFHGLFKHNNIRYELKEHIQFTTPEELSQFIVQVHTCWQEKVGGPDDMNIVLFEERNPCVFFFHLSFNQSL